MFIVFWAPRGTSAGCAIIFIPIAAVLVVVGLIALIAGDAYTQYKTEAAYRTEYGAEWQKQYEQRFGPIPRAHNRIVIGIAGLAVIGTLMTVLFKQFRKSMGAGHQSSGRKSSKRRLAATASSPDSPPPHNGRRRGRGNADRGKIWLICIFFALRAIDPFFYFGAAPGHETEVLGSILISTLWTAALMIGIWTGKNWARYILMGLLLIGLYSNFTDIATVQVLGFSVSLLFLMAVAIKVASVLTLGISKDIKRLSKNP